MLRFQQFLPTSGIYPAENFMIVPGESFNLVALLDADGADLSYDHHRLQIEPLGFEQVERVAQEYIEYHYRKSTSDERSDQLLRLKTALHNTIGSRGRHKALKITPHGTGIPPLEAKRGAATARIEVAILARKDIPIAFRFLQAPADSGRNEPLTRFSPGDASRFTERLSWIYGAQANIFFNLVSADWLPLPSGVPTKLDKTTFTRDLAPKKDRNAEITCYLTSDYDAVDEDAAGQYFPDTKVCVVMDQGNPAVFDYGESFIGVLAHEIGHHLHHRRNLPGSGHHDRNGILMSSGMESLSLDKQFVINMNPW